MEMEEEDSGIIKGLVIIQEDNGSPSNQDLYNKLVKRFPATKIAISKDGGGDYVDNKDYAFLLHEFSGENYTRLMSFKGLSIYGPTALLELDHLVRITRPLYCNSMSGLIICFTGYRKKEDLQKFLFMIHNMGGSIRKDFGTKVTHLVASDCSGDKYRYAATFGIPIVSSEWLNKSWERRHEINFKATEIIGECKVKPFHGAKIALVGFTDTEEREHMVGELLRNGGVECADYKTDPCTHIVIDEANVSSMPSDIQSRTYVVKSEWFWASIQMDACAEEKMFQFSDHVSLLSPRNNLLSPTTPGSHNRKRKRQNRKEIVNALAQNDPLPSYLSAPGKPSRRSSVGDVAMLSVSGSFLDTPDLNTTASEAAAADGGASLPPTSPGSIPKINLSQMSPRQQVFTELVTTENNYVNILKTIIEVFKKPLEEPDKVGGTFLNNTEMKMIFGNIPPIYDVHRGMLNEFTALVNDWKPDHCIGNVFLKYADELTKTYPPFVNFFETTKNSLAEASKRNPRFHAFLKVCQSKPECGRQSLSELLIRPVQRLPSISLLLNDLLKHTKREKDHPDAKALEMALAKIKEIMTHINEDKRKTESRMHIFDIFKDIENCPPNLVSSHRSFFCKVQVLEIGASDELCGKGYELALFLFSDVLEISKKRSVSKGLGFRSPSALSLTNSHHLQQNHRSAGGHRGTHHAGQGSGNGSSLPGGIQTHKHVDLMNLTAIKRVVDVPDTDEHHGIFALVCRSNQELKERMFIFQLISGETDKMRFLKSLCRNVANTMCRPDPDTYLTTMRAEDLELESSDLNVSNLSRAYVKLHRTKQKVGRAFSFNKTPTNALKRAVSSMISPLANRDRLNSAPSGDLQAMRLSSCSNLMCAESPRSSRSRGFPSASPARGATVKTSTASLNTTSTSTTNSDSPLKDGSFTIPRTPQLSVRRPSFKFKTKTLSKKF